MNLTELVIAIKADTIKKRSKEQELLQEIEKLTDVETAEAAADYFTSEKHAYSFDGYLYQLERLVTVLSAGIPAEQAFELVDTCIPINQIISAYKIAQKSWQ